MCAGSPMSALVFDGGCAPAVGFSWSRSGSGAGGLGGGPSPALSGFCEVVLSSATPELSHWRSCRESTVVAASLCEARFLTMSTLAPPTGRRLQRLTSDETRDGLPSPRRTFRDRSHKLFRRRSAFLPRSPCCLPTRRLSPKETPGRWSASAAKV